MSKFRGQRTTGGGAASVANPENPAKHNVLRGPPETHILRAGSAPATAELVGVVVGGESPLRLQNVPPPTGFL